MPRKPLAKTIVYRCECGRLVPANPDGTCYRTIPRTNTPICTWCESGRQNSRRKS